MKFVLLISLMFLVGCSGDTINILSAKPLVFKNWQHQANEFNFDSSSFESYGTNELKISNNSGLNCVFEADFIGKETNGSVYIKSKTSGGTNCDTYLGQYYYSTNDSSLELCDTNNCDVFY